MLFQNKAVMKLCCYITLKPNDMAHFSNYFLFRLDFNLVLGCLSSNIINRSNHKVICFAMTYS